MEKKLFVPLGRVFSHRVIAAAAIVNEILAVILAKFAFKLAGEIQE